MGLRTRLRERVSALLGPDNSTPAPPPAPVARTSVATAADLPPSSAARAEARADAGAAPAPKPAAKAAAPALSPEDQAKQDKIAAHFEKARRGVLKYLVDHDGFSHMGEMHDYSEKRFFIAHQAFSRLMEGFVAEGLIRYDAQSGVSEITDEGRAYLG